jgi:hypothetical protein
MSKERAQDLAELCTELVRKRNDFPTVWETVLKNHALVNGIPESKLEGKRLTLEIHLLRVSDWYLIAIAKYSASNRTSGRGDDP